VSSGSGAVWRRRQHGDLVGAAFTEHWSVAPNKIGGYKPRAIAGEHRTWLLARIKEKDFTLLGLVGELAERGLKVDYRSVWTFVHDEKFSFKKKRGGWRTRPS
jgi:transposase